MIVRNIALFSAVLLISGVVGYHGISWWASLPMVYRDYSGRCLAVEEVTPTGPVWHSCGWEAGKVVMEIVAAPDFVMTARQ